MPGVPYEMKGMMDNFIIPFFEKKDTGLVIRHRTLKTTGIAESFLAEQIGNVGSLFSPGSGASLAFLPSSLGVRLRITAKASNISEAENLIRDVEKKIRDKAQRLYLRYRRRGTRRDRRKHACIAQSDSLNQPNRALAD